MRRQRVEHKKIKLEIIITNISDNTVKLEYYSVDDTFVKELNSKREAKEGVYFLHPPRGGFKKSSRLPTPKGILGKHEDIVKLAGRML